MVKGLLVENGQLRTVPGNIRGALQIANLIMGFVVALVMVSLWFSNRLETPTEKDARIRTLLEPIRLQVDHNAVEIDALREVDSRVLELLNVKADRAEVPPRWLQEKITGIEQDIKELRRSCGG